MRYRVEVEWGAEQAKKAGVTKSGYTFNSNQAKFMQELQSAWEQSGATVKVTKIK